MHAWLCAPCKDGHPASNNYVRDRLAALKAFLAWLEDEEVLPANFSRKIDWKYWRTEYPRVYGKRQAFYPARFLTYEQAYGTLLAACQDGTWIGSRDQLAIRLGLTGLRRKEIVGLTWGNYHNGAIVCTGKRNRVREVRPGPTLTTMLTVWRRKYEAELGRAVTSTDPLLCATSRGLYGAAHGTPSGYQKHRNRGEPACQPCKDANAAYHTAYLQGERLRSSKPAPAIAWGEPLGYTAAWDLLARRATLAGLGHVTPHDLRRATATILYQARTADGAHLYDLLDIQRVMDHSDPATTQRSYLDHLDTEVKSRAGETLD